MAITKPTKPGVNLPEKFGGIKTPYNENQIREGYQDGVPQTVDGGNINFEKDALFQKTKYVEGTADIINGMTTGTFLTVDGNNKFNYTPTNSKQDTATAVTFEEYGTVEIPEVK